MYFPELLNAHLAALLTPEPVSDRALDDPLMPKNPCPKTQTRMLLSTENTSLIFDYYPSGNPVV
jgi:hypothetical protein